MIAHKRFTSLLCVLLLSALLISCVAPPVQTVTPDSPAVTDPLTAELPTAELDSQMADRIDNLAQSTITKYTLPGMAIGIVKDGAVVYTKGFGLGNIETETPFTPQSQFSMASLSKAFTAAAIMQLVEAGKIDLDAPVVDYLPDFRVDHPQSAEITVRDMLGHRSGLPFYATEGDRWTAAGYDNPDNEDGALDRFVVSLSDVKLLAEPGGDKTLYSNLGFDTLGAIVAKVSGQDYETYVKENILLPLGMAHSTFLLDETDPELLSTGYRRLAEGSGATAWPSFPFNRQHSPGAGLISTVDDMNRWAMTMLNGAELNGTRILASESLDQMWTPQSNFGPSGLLQDYGMGWFLAEEQGHRFVWHPGGTPGFNSTIILAPDDGLAVITLVNLNSIAPNEPWYATEAGTGAMFTLLGLN